MASPVIVIEVEPGEITKVAGVKLDFEGDIAQHHGSRRHRPARGNPHAAGACRSATASPRTTGIGPSPTPCGSWSARRYPAGRVSYSLADIDAPGRPRRAGPAARFGPAVSPGRDAGTRHRALRRRSGAPAGPPAAQEACTTRRRSPGPSCACRAAATTTRRSSSSTPRTIPTPRRCRSLCARRRCKRSCWAWACPPTAAPRASVEYRYNRVPGIDWRAVTKLQLETQIAVRRDRVDGHTRRRTAGAGACWPASSVWTTTSW